MIEVPKGQYRYVTALKDGAMTTRDLALSFCVTTSCVARVMQSLRAAGMVESTRMKGIQGGVMQHNLIVKYDNICFRKNVRHNNGREVEPDVEIKYAAELRKAGLIGQRLTSKYRERYPDRTHSSILKTIVRKAMKQGLCRWVLRC